jgi:hypothetical protein
VERPEARPASSPASPVAECRAGGNEVGSLIASVNDADGDIIEVLQFPAA